MADEVSHQTDQETEHPAHFPKMGWISIVLIVLLTVVGAVIWVKHRPQRPETM